LLPVPYYHVVFTLPAQIADIACKIACNIDPLRGLFASNSDPL